MADERKVAWFVAIEESELPKCLVHVQTQQEADGSIPPPVINYATSEMAAEEMDEEATITITRTFMTDAEIEALPDL